MAVLGWLNDQLLRMNWLKALIGSLVEKAFGLDLEGKVGTSVHLFFYDSIKVFILLSLLIPTISYIKSFFPPEGTRKILGRFKGISANIVGALLGTMTPFCSYSSIPLFMGFTSAGFLRKHSDAGDNYNRLSV